MTLLLGITQRRITALFTPARPFKKANRWLPERINGPGGWLRRERIFKGLTLRQVAQITGIGRNRIARIELGLRTPSPEQWAKLTAAIGSSKTQHDFEPNTGV